MRHPTGFTVILFCSFMFSHAQTPAVSKPAKSLTDVLIFLNGDRLTGKLERVADGQVVFSSEMAGELTLPIEKVKELRSGREFALLRKGESVGPQVEAGAVDLSNGSFTLTRPGNASATVSAGEVAYLVDKATFDKEVSQKAGVRDGWTGTATGGVNIERSTTSGTTLNAGLAMVRTIPLVPWMPARNRTSVNVMESYGRLSTVIIPPTNPASPATVVKSSIFHTDLERDQYFSPRFFALADTSFDHNYGQGLQLQQLYGGGVGWTAVKRVKQQLDLKVDVHFERQQYITPPANGVGATVTPPVDIIGSTFFEQYRRDLPGKILFTETANILPAWNNFQAYSANVTAALSMPLFKRLSATITTTDDYLNDPAQYYRKNSYQFITGVTYLLR